MAATVVILRAMAGALEEASMPTAAGGGARAGEQGGESPGAGDNGLMALEAAGRGGAGPRTALVVLY
jgi:hypothetical protein